MYFYLALTILSAIFTMTYIVMWRKNFDVNFTLIFTFIPILNLGYLWYENARNLEEILLCVKISYVGGSYMLLFIMFIILSLCNIEVKLWQRIVSFVVATLIFLLPLTIEYNDLLYKSVTLTKVDGRNFLIKEYGPMHVVFHIQAIIFIAISLSALIYAIFKKKNVSKKTIILLTIPLIFCAFGYFGGRLLKCEYELLPLGYVLAQAVYLIIIRRVCRYDISDTGFESIVSEGDTGFMSFDGKFNYLGCDKVADKLFEEFSDVRVDTTQYKDTKAGAFIYDKLCDFIKDEKHNTFYFEKDDRIYLITIYHMDKDGRHDYYNLSIKDDTEEQKYVALLNDFNESLQDEVERKTKSIEQMHDNLILSMAAMVESRDNSTGGHIRRTSDVVRILIDEILKDDELNLSDKFCHDIIKAAPMHDLGKIAVDDAILRKPGKFTDEEYEIMKTHAAEGAKIVHEILKNTDDHDFHILAENVAHYHHERWDGSGYPEGLKGEEIPIEARIMAVADVYDALVSKRVYKERMSFEQADSIIMEGMGKHFDKRLEKYYVKSRKRLEAYYAEAE